MSLVGQRMACLCLCRWFGTRGPDGAGPVVCAREIIMTKANSRRYRSRLREQRGTAGPARRAVLDEKRSVANDVSFPEGFADGQRKELASRIGELAAAERLATDELERALAIAAE